MTIRKSLSALLATLMLLSLLPLALAEDTLTLGDGAPIPYMEGFTSRLIRDPALMTGITGKADIRFQQEDNHTEGTQSHVDIHIQNIALTDDALALFFRAEYPDFLPLNYGTAQESYNQAVPFVMPLLNGDSLNMVNTWSEGHPDGDRAIQCLVVYSLEKPIPDGAVLSFYGKGQVKVDKSGAKDGTRAADPMLSVRLNFERKPGATLDYQFKVARISFGPFGNRLLIINRDDGRGIGMLPCVLEDENGQRLPVISTGYRGSGLASPVNPVDMYNEVLFLGGEEMNKLRLIPFQSTRLDDNPQSTVLPLSGPFPAKVPLSGGAELTIFSIQVDDHGYSIRYSTTGPDHFFFELGDDKGQPIKKLSDQAVGFDGFDFSANVLVSSSIWVAEYKGKQVSRVSLDEIRAAKTLVIGHSRNENKALNDLMVEVPLK